MHLILLTQKRNGILLLVYDQVVYYINAATKIQESKDQFPLLTKKNELDLIIVISVSGWC